MTEMHIGMMWFDSDEESPLLQRIERAVEYYRAKYGARPNVLFLHPETRGEEVLESEPNLEIEVSPTVLPDHFWLGVGAEEGALRQ